MEADSTETSARAQDTTSCAPVSYQFHLFGAFNAVCSKGKNGVQTCQAISSYLQDRAAHEQFYSKQLAKIQQNVKTEDWAKHVANTWNTFHHTIAAISLEYAEFSNMHTSSIVSGMKACTSQQESQIQRLITEGSKLRTQYVECMNKMSKAKERYDKKCAEAIDTIQSIRRPPAADGTSDKVDIFSKVWDNTAKGLGLGSLERQKQRMASCLEDVVASEDAYVRSVDAMNIQYTSYERQVQENLIAFEVTEEQRLEYIKDLLVRSEKSRNAMMGRVERLISGMREALKSIDVLDDIDDGFTKLLGLKHKEGNDVELQVDISPASITALVLKMQTMTDQGVVFTHTMLNTLVECISAEETLVGALERIHTSYSPLSNEAATLFSSAAPVVFAEGTTLDRGWGAVLMHMQRVAYLHKEFGSLLAEPVSLSLDTMKTEYIETKLKMDDELHHLLASVATDMASHTKLEQKLDAKSKELAVTKASLASNIEKDAMLQRFMESPVDRERKLVVKSDLLQDEVADLKGQVDASGAAMTAKLELRRQDICQIVSLCMKNEKYRLDVKKSSLRSLVKAHEHLVAGLLHASTAVLREVETISPVSDIREFIRQAQVPWQAHEPMIPTLHGNALLATELKTFEKTPQPKLSRALSSLSIRTATIAPTDDSNNKTAALQDKVLAAEAEKEDSFGHSDLQKNFNLPPSEQVVTSFSCALYLNNFPHHGRLFLSQSYLCFAGWRESYVVVPIIEIAIVEKKNTALVVPNGMELTTTTQGKHFFASFIFRDECVQAILQLQQIKKQTQDILAPELTTALSETPSDDPTIAFVPAATTTLDLVEELAILSQDYDTVVDQLVLPFSVDVAFTQFWQPTTFLTTLLESCGETLVNVGSWHSNETSYAAFDRLEQFQAVRTVAYTHNKKYMVGPSSIPTVQKQRLKYDKANGCLVLTVTTTVTDAPYHDYFRAESRWVFSTAATHSPNECRLDTGVRLHWIKNTWLKKQIESATASESKETMKYWTVQAIEAYQAKPAQDVPAASPESSPEVEQPKTTRNTQVLPRPRSIAESFPSRSRDILVLVGLAIVLWYVHQLTATLHHVVRVQADQQKLLDAILAQLSSRPR